MDKITISLLTVCGLLLAGTARANEITFALTDSGDFQANNQHIQFSNLSFTPTSGVGGTTIGGSYTGINLGTFALSRGSDNFNYQNSTFILGVTFSLPTGISGTPGSSFTATLDGNIQKKLNKDNALTIDFASPSRSFSFNDGTAEGGFLFSITEPLVIDLASGVSSTQGILYGSISEAWQNTLERPPAPTSPTPEPSSIMLLGTGLIGLGIALRKTTRRKARQE